MEKYISILFVNDVLQAQIFKLFLESNGILAVVSQESAASAIGLTVGPLGEIEIRVPESKAEEARQILKEMEEGKYEED